MAQPTPIAAFSDIPEEPEIGNAPAKQAEAAPAKSDDTSGAAPTAKKHKRNEAPEADEPERTRRATTILPLSTYRALREELHLRNTASLDAGDDRIETVSSLMKELIEEGLLRARKKRGSA